jgi:protein-S-isoprenylcysteine O-methyltransferase Ste14
MEIPEAYLNFSAAFFLFALLHSLTATKWFKRKAHPIFDEGYRLVYSIFSVVTLTPALYLYYLYLPGSSMIFEAPGYLYVPLSAFRAVCLLAMSYTLYKRGALSFVGLKKDNQNSLVTTGTYSIVRHPIFFFGILFLWADPAFSEIELLFAALASGYLVFGSYLEESRLREDFGEEYLKYVEEVPMWLPKLRRRQ